MPPKAKLPAPIDRPLSRAYLREFSGWSTAYPPGLSEPTSLRKMENILVHRDGSAGVRPGLRYLSYAEVPTADAAGVAFDRPIVGTHEAFYLNDGSKAYLFACRELDDTVGFRVLQFDAESQTVRGLTDAGVDFVVPSGEEALAFTAATQYVKYLQIDNKIFALSDAGETMRLFTVGSSKSARKLSSIERPNWTVEDKLTIVQPEAVWISDGVPVSVRTNMLTNPSFEGGLNPWHTYGPCFGLSQGAMTHDGGSAVRLESLPLRTNLMTSPLHDVAATGLAHWAPGTGSGGVIDVSGDYLRWVRFVTSGTQRAYVNAPRNAASAGKIYTMAADWTANTNCSNPKMGYLYRFYNSSGTELHEGVLTWNSADGRHSRNTVAAPSGTTSMGVYPFVEGTYPGGINRFIGGGIKNVVVCLSSESSSALDGNDGADYFWTGDVNNSASVYHPPQNVVLYCENVGVTPGETYTYSNYVRALSSTDDVEQQLSWRDSSNSVVAVSVGASVTDSSVAWTRPVVTDVAPATAASVVVTTVFESVARGVYHVVDSALLEKSGSAGAYFDGSSNNTSALRHAFTGAAHASTSTETLWSVGTTLPTAETPTANTLISSTAASNVFNFGFFYTFYNEVGDSAASQITVVRTQRRWTGWRWETPNAAGEPSGTTTADPTFCADQLVAIMPQSAFDEARSQGAVGWNLFMFTWSDQDVVPVTAVKIDTKTFSETSTHAADGWLRATPAITQDDEVAVLPSQSSRYNYSAPSRGGQGLVAADRMVVVKDPTAAAVIRWTSNLQGSYTDFSASRGGGYKTLTSGNLYIPACVKLWQNPQSSDTLTVLCLGTDGHSTGYYMQPAQVASQSEAVNIMGFEETTATPGTVSPYGCEVLNNTLYHPLDDVLMKSTASNYNINHKEVTEQIRNLWSGLLNKEHIVSSQLDNRLYYIVRNPSGHPMPEGCWGNEIWVFDGASPAGSWSRFLIPAQSLRKIERNDKVYMSVSTPKGIFYLDPEYDRDDVVLEDGTVGTRFIPWMLETNTQGANRAHDAWAHLQQAGIGVGNWQGNMRYGIRSFDLNGKPVEISKLLRDLNAPDSLPFDLEDYLQIRRDLKEWFFFAESVKDAEDETLLSSGQINLVQYRYTPVSVNVGYEYGSIETFEYQRFSANAADPGFTTNGTPEPMIDTRRP